MINKRKSLVIGVMASLVLAATPAMAGPLTLAETPDIVSGFISTIYDGSTLTANGFAFELDDDGVAPTLGITGGTFDLMASINGAGLFSGGTLDIGGTIASLGFNSGTLLTGVLTDLAFASGTGGQLDFIFSVTGGDAAGLFGGIGALGGIIMGDTGFAGSWTAFDSFMASADVAALPVAEPGILLLQALGLTLLLLARRRPS